MLLDVSARWRDYSTGGQIKLEVSVRESISLRIRKPCTHNICNESLSKKPRLSYGYAGVLFVVSAGNIQNALEIEGISLGDFENISIQERQNPIRISQREQCHERTLSSPSEALNVLTVGAASQDLGSSIQNVPTRTAEICQPGEFLPAISSGVGPFKCIKPDLIATGRHHEIAPWTKDDTLELRVVQETARTGSSVVWINEGVLSRSRGTSYAAALVTRFLINVPAALTEEDGPYDEHELSRIDLALLTRALAINGSVWPKTADTFYEQSVLGTMGTATNRLQRKWRAISAMTFWA